MGPKSTDRRLGVNLRVLTESQIEDIHLASLEILSRTGIIIQHEKARDLLAEAGAAIDGELVRIPPDLAKAALAAAPERVLLYNRRGEPAVDLGADRSYFGTGSDTPTYLDPYTGELKESNRDSVRTIARLCDALPNMDFVMSMGIAKERGTSSFVHQYAAMTEGTVKPIVFTAQGEKDIGPIYEIALALAGDDEALLRVQPRCLLYTEPISPLFYGREALEMLLFCAEKSLPVTSPAAIMSGATGPATLAGAIALANAETLAALVILQLARRGTPYVYGGNVSVMDMRTTMFTYGAPEFHLAFAALADMGHYYKLPIWGLAGASDAKTLDAQAAAEASYQILLARLSGNNLVHDVGYLNTGLTASMELIVLCDEIVDYTNHIAAGVEVNAHTLALDVIHEVGPRGHFLETDHTLANFRDCIWRPSFLERSSYDTWKDEGARDLFVKLNERVKEIIETYETEPLPAAAQARIDEILARREKLAG